jgi:hypothetical protein
MRTVRLVLGFLAVVVAVRLAAPYIAYHLGFGIETKDMWWRR